MSRTHKDSRFTPRPAYNVHFQSLGYRACTFLDIPLVAQETPQRRGRAPRRWWYDDTRNAWRRLK